MSFEFYVLPDDQAPSAQNMALDLSLLENFPQPDALRIRHYGWNDTAFTFGYSQPYEWVQATAASPDVEPSIIRRPTGGGIVDHRNDWTYALVIPAEHPRCRGNAAETYRIVHEALADAISDLGSPAESYPCPGCDRPKAPSLCFAGPEPYDVVRKGTAVKLAGAAQKRNRNGLLLQGSVDKAATGAIDWAKLRDQFAAKLKAVLKANEPQPCDAPDYSHLHSLTQQFESQAWNQKR